MTKIELRKISTEKDTKAHSYPFQIAYQAQEFIQGAIFYISIADISSGTYFKQVNSLNELRLQFIGGGGELSTWEQGWQILTKYEDIFKITVFQNVLVAINSHWDWYIRKLGEFISFARPYVPSPVLNHKEENDLNRIGFLTICHQLAVLEKTCSLDFGISNSEKEVLMEMSLVRNLGLHNRWEVDQKYLDLTPDKRVWMNGELRLFDSTELKIWHENMLKVISKTSKMVAIKYLGVPSYPHK